jgi:flagellar motor switch protein FliM
MMNRDLTSDELESLITATSDEDGEPSRSSVTIRPPRPSDGSRDRSPSVAGAAFVPSAIETLTTVCDSWCRSLQTPLRAPVAMSDVKSRLFHPPQLIRQIGKPACIQVFDVDSGGGCLFLQVDGPLVFIMIDRLLGGGRQPSPIVRRPLTEIETGLFLRLTESWQEQMGRALSQHQPAKLRALRVESTPQRLPFATAEQIAVVEMTLQVADHVGRCRVGLPLSMLDALQLSNPTGGVEENLPPSGLVVIAGNVRLRDDESHTLRVGQTVFAENAMPRVYVDRKLMYTGRLGASGDRKAVQIEEHVDGDPSVRRTDT